MTAIGADPFADLQARYAELLDRYQQGQIDAAAFAQAVGQLQVQDDRGAWWQISAETGGWLWWDGQTWQEADAGGASVATAAVTAPPATTPAAPPSGLVGEILQGIGTTTVTSVKSLPRMLLRYFLVRAPFMALTFGAAWLYHTYLLVFPNGGFNPDTELSRWINVTGNSSSAVAIWGAVSALLWSFAYSVLTVGPVRAIKDLAMAPVRMVQMLGAGGRSSTGAFLVGVGIAVAVGTALQLNLTANFALAGALTVLGLSQPGWILASFLTGIVQAVLTPISRRATGKVPLDPAAVQLVMSGIGPGFLVAGLIGPSFGTAIGVALIAAGLVLWLTGRGARTPVEQVVALVLIGGFATVLYALLHHLLATIVSADDGGASECGKQNMAEYMAARSECAGSDEALNNGLGPATGSAVSTLTPPLSQKDIYYYALDVQVQPATIQADGQASVSVYARVNTNDPTADADAMSQAITIALGGPQVGWTQRGVTEFNGGYMATAFTALAPANAAAAGGPFTVAISAVCPGPKGPLSGSASVTLTVAGQPMIATRFVPAGRTGLIPDGKDHLWLYARVEMPEPVDPALDLKAIQDTLDFAYGASADWLEISASSTEEDWKYVYVKTPEPEAHGAGTGTLSLPPSQASIIVSAQVGELTIQQSVAIPLLPMPELDAKPDWVEFLAGAGDSKDVKVFVENPGADPWEFDYELDDDAKKLVQATLTPEGPATATASITEASGEGSSGGSSYQIGLLKLFSVREETKLERHVKVAVAQQGLFVQPTGRHPEDGSFHLPADGTGVIDIDFVVYLWDDSAKELVSDPSAVQDLEITFVEGQDDPVRNAFQVAEVLEHAQCEGVRQLNVPTGIYRFRAVREVPADRPLIFGQLQASVRGKSEEEYTKQFTIGLECPTSGPMSDDWRLELRRCEEIIDKYVPIDYRPKLREILENRKMLLGAAGLYRLRHQIWRIAQNLTLAEGDRGWEEVARWANRITVVLQWTQWACELVSEALMTATLGPVAQAAIPLVRSMSISLLNEVIQGGKPLDEWFKEQAFGIFMMPAAIMTDPVLLQAKFDMSPTKAWAIFVAYNIGFNLAMGQSLTDATINAARAARDRAISMWLAGKLARPKIPGAPATPGGPDVPPKPGGAKPTAPPPAKPSGTRPTVPPPAKPSGTRPTKTGKKSATAPEATTSPTQKVKNLTESVKTDANGKPYAELDDVLKVQRDTRATRTLKKAGDTVQKGFDNTLREKVYKPHDDALKAHCADWLKKNPPPGLKGIKNPIIRVDEFRTPGAKGGGLNTDRDFRTMYLDKNGNWVEIPKEAWLDHSYKKFGELTGFDKDRLKSLLPADERAMVDRMTPEQQHQMWAEKHGQRGTDKLDSEACADYSDQVVDPVSGEHTRRTPNVIRVEHGVGKLKDPVGMGKMYQEKVGNSLKVGNKPEAFAQAKKGVDTLQKVRKGYEMQGINTGKLPPELQQGMNVVEKVPTDFRATPEAIKQAEADLAKIGFKGGLDEFTRGLGKHFGSLQASGE